jgi:Ice-binding-like/PEP-CTERM motif
MKSRSLFVGFTAAALSAALVCGPSPSLADPVLSSDLADFAVLAGTSGVTNVPTSTINGDLGSTNASVVANGSGYVFQTGESVQADTPLAAQAQLDLGTAITYLNGLPTNGSVSSDLTGDIIAPGVYTGAALLTGALTLQGDNASGDTWVFLTGGFTTGTDSSVTITDVGPDASVYWVDSSSVTLGVDSTFLGNILAYTSIAIDTGATDYCGRALAQTAVTLEMNTIGNDCTAEGLPANLAGTNGLSGASSSTVAVPEPSTLALFGGGLAGLLGLTVRRRREKGARI